MHTVQFSFYIVLVWAPAWSIYWLNTGGKAAILAFSNFNGYSARSRSCSRRLEKEIENIIAGWSSSVAYCMCYMNVCYDEEQRADERDRGPDGREKKERGEGFSCFCYLSVTEVKPCNISLIHYPVQYIRGQYCTLPAESTLILRGEDLQCWIFVL